MSEKKEIGFTRRHPDSGNWAMHYKGKNIKLADREVLFTVDPKLIKVLKADPEIKEFQAETKKQAPLKFEEMDTEQLKIEAAKRKIDHSQMKKKGELVDELEGFDNENSKEENDQGETQK